MLPWCEVGSYPGFWERCCQGAESLTGMWAFVLLARTHWKVRQPWRSLSSPARTLGLGPPLCIHPVWSEFLQGMLKAPKRPPSAFMWLSSVCTLCPGRPAMAAVTGLFVLIKHTAKAITTYIERSSWDHFSFKVRCACGEHWRVYSTHCLPQLV